MSDKPTLEQLLEVQEHFGLPGPALVEKDWYVVKALAAIAAVDTGDFRLVFGGGTALSRAYKLTERMSEDVDLKIVCDKNPSRGALRTLRTAITDALLSAGFVFDPDDEKHRLSMYKGHYTKYQLPYKPITEGKGILRPDVQIETSMWPLRRDAVDKPVISFIAEAHGRDPELPKIACSSVLETAAEKLVALTWRAGSELAGLREERDPTLVRHIYDLHMIRDGYDAAEVATLAHDVMKADAATRGDRFPAWQKDLLSETLRAIEGMSTRRSRTATPISSVTWSMATSQISLRRWTRSTRLPTISKTYQPSVTVVPFTRPTIIAAVALIDRTLGQASFNHLVLRLA